MDLFDDNNIEVIGVDLGTQNSVVTGFDENGDFIHVSENGKNSVSSALFFKNRDEIDFGESAEKKAVLYPKSVLRCFKRGLSGDQARLVNGKYEIEFADTHEKFYLEPKDAYEELLRNLLNKYNEKYEKNVTSLVLTVPAKFGPALIQACRQGGMNCGLDDVLVLQEPVAAAICYDSVNEIPENSYLLVYDLGAGTFDISLLKKSNGILEYIDTNGNVSLGGEDFTNDVIKHAKDSLFDNDDVDLEEYRNEYLKNMEKLRKHSEDAKESLSFRSIVSDTISLNTGNLDNYDWCITQNQFEQLIAEKVNSTIEKIELILQRNNLSKDDIGTVLVVGGSSQIPMVSKKVKGFFGNSTNVVDADDKELMISKGAALVARDVFENGGNNAMNFTGIIKKTSDTIAVCMGNSFNFKDVFARGITVPAETTLHCNLEDIMKGSSINIQFYSYEPLARNVLVPASHNTVNEYIGSFRQAVKENSGSADLHISISEEYIMSIEVLKDGNKIAQGTVQGDGM